jgi:hypothetical protein
MRKIVILLAIILFSGMMTESFAGKNRTLSKGFSINYTIGIPSNNYGYESDADISDEYKSGILLGLQIGSRWYIKPSEKLGFGIMVNWFDISVGAKIYDDVTRFVSDMSFLEVGPIGTFALTNSVALDAYYNLRPTMFLQSYTSSNNTEMAAFNSTLGFGASHALGTAFRWKVLNLGVEYVFGKINSFSTDTSNDLTEKLLVNNFRIKMGFKF